MEEKALVTVTSGAVGTVIGTTRSRRFTAAVETRIGVDFVNKISRFLSKLSRKDKSDPLISRCPTAFPLCRAVKEGMMRDEIWRDMESLVEVSVTMENSLRICLLKLKKHLTRITG